MPTIEELTTPVRHERDMTRLVGTIDQLRQARFDVVADQSALSIADDLSSVSISTGEATLTETGVVESEFNAEYTRPAFRQVAERLRIPVPYLDRLAAEPANAELAAVSINWLAETDTRRALYRFLRADDGALVLRAVLSDRFSLGLDNEVAMQALLAGLGDSGIVDPATGEGIGDLQVDGDLTPDRLRMRIVVPTIELAVPDLLGDYRMPFSMREDRGVHARPEAGETPPVIRAGVEIANSETGKGRFIIRPRAEVLICRNGLTRPIEFGKNHIGAQLDEGNIDWSDATRQNALDLIASQVGDVFRTYLTTDYLERIAAEMRQAKEQQVESPAKAVEIVTDRFGLSDSESRNVLDCFMRGGDSTVLGVGQAMTAAAQLVDDGDRQAEIEETFWQIVETPGALVTA